MFETVVLPRTLWLWLSHLGAAGWLLPLWTAAAAGLWRARQGRALVRWALALAVAVLLTLGSKILFLGWGLGWSAWDFTGVSGHAMLATSVYPVLARFLLAGCGGLDRRLPGVLGLTLAAWVGLSRIALGFHSPSEVLAGWVLGAAVSLFTLAALRELRAPPPWPWLAAGLLPVLLLAVLRGTPRLPTHEWEQRLALRLSGAERVQTREQFRHLPRAVGAPAID